MAVYCDRRSSVVSPCVCLLVTLVRRAKTNELIESRDAIGCDHRLRGSASPVLTATGLVNGKWQFSTPHRIDTPKPITKKFVTGDEIWHEEAFRHS